MNTRSFQVSGTYRQFKLSYDKIILIHESSLEFHEIFTTDQLIEDIRRNVGREDLIYKLVSGLIEYEKRIQRHPNLTRSPYYAGKRYLKEVFKYRFVEKHLFI